MTKKDYELIARVLLTARNDWLSDETTDTMSEDFADELAKTNPRFKRDVFLRACGVES
jgi:hypothetical protein